MTAKCLITPRRVTLAARVESLALHRLVMSLT